MGVVYLAQETALQRQVAAKFLRGTEWSDETLDRFFEEALALARLEHPNIVRFIDFGDRYETPYIALEFIDGGSLSNKLRQGAIKVEQALAWGDQLCDAMAFAHSKGILHRDLKSDNVMIARDGTLKVTDFGLARRDDRRATLTATGMIMGTPSYISPEQAKGLKAGPASDIYSAGVVLFELLTGRRPFEGGSVFDLLEAQVRRPPPNLRSFRPNLPEGLCRVVLRALAKDPEERYPNFEAFRSALASPPDLAAAPPPPEATIQMKKAPPPDLTAPLRTQTSGLHRFSPTTPNAGSTRHRPHAIALFAVAIVVGCLALGLTWTRLKPAPPSAVEVRKNLTITPATRHIALRWRTSTPHRFRVVVRKPGKPAPLLVRQDPKPCENHAFKIAPLRPASTFEVEIEWGTDTIKETVKTLPITLTRGVLTFAFEGAFWADFETNATQGLKLEVTSRGGVPKRHPVSGSGGTVILEGKPEKAQWPHRWRLLHRGIPLARGMVRQAFECYGQSPLMRAEIKGYPYPEANPVWFDDSFVLADDAGVVAAYSFHRTTGPVEPSAHTAWGPLRRDWAFVVPDMPDRRSNACYLGGIAALPSGRIAFASFNGKHCLDFWILDVAERRAKWRARKGPRDPRGPTPHDGKARGSAMGNVDTLPRWALEEKTDWFRLSERERRLGIPLVGQIPKQAAAYSKGDLFLLTMAHPERSRTCAFLRIDPAQPTLRWKCFVKIPLPGKYGVAAGLIICGDWVFAVFSTPLRGKPTRYRHAVIACPTSKEEPDGGAAHVCYTFESLAKNMPPVPDEKGKSLWLCKDDAFIRLRVDKDGIREEILPIEGLQPHLSYVAAPPFLYEGERHSILFQKRTGPAGKRDGSLTRYINIYSRNAFLATRRPDGKLHPYDPPLFLASRQDKAPYVSCIARQGPIAVGIVMDSVFALNLKTRKAGDSSLRKKSFGALSFGRQGIVAIVDDDCRIFTLPADLFTLTKPISFSRQ